MTTFTTYGALTAVSAGTQLTTGMDAYSTWTEISASIAADIKAVYLMYRNRSHEATAFQLAIGAAAAEVVFVETVLSSRYSMMNCSYYPVDIASGTRLAWRAAATDGVAPEAVLVTASTDVAALTSPSQNIYGMDETGADIMQVTYDPGATINTRGGWVEITPASAISATAKWLFINIGLNDNINRTSANFLLSLSFGADVAAAGTNELISNLQLSIHGDTDAVMPLRLGPFKTDDLANQRIWINAQCSITDAVDRLFSCSVEAISGAEITAGGGGGGIKLAGPGGGMAG